MAITFKLKEAGTTTEIDLIYDPSSNPSYQMHQGSQSLSSSLRALFHRPETGVPILSRLAPDIRTAVFRFNIEGSSSASNKADDTLNKINALERWLGGHDQQAARAFLDSDVNRIELHVAIAGATNTTILPVVYGETSFFGSLFNVFGEDNKMAHSGSVRLYLAELGEGTTITLRNDLNSSPHMVEDSNSDGLADGWTKQLTPTTTINTTNWLLGGKSMRVAFSASNQGVYHRITITSGEDLGGYVWVLPAGAASVSITLRSNNGANVIVAYTLDASDSNSVSDRSAVDSAGFTWYRVPLSGNAGAFTNAEIRVVSSTTSGSFYVDAAYLRRGTTTIPDAWCSSSSVMGRYDVSSSNEERINYLDIAHIPGDGPALLSLAFDATAGENEITRIARYSGKNAHNVDHYRESDEFSSLSGSWSTGTGTSDNHFWQLASGSASGRIDYPSDWQYLAKKVARVFVAARASGTAARISYMIAAGDPSLGSSYIAATNKRSVVTANVWEILDLGYINLINYSDGSANLYEVVDVDTASGLTVDIDFVVIVPVGDYDELLITRVDSLDGSASSTQDFTTSGADKTVRGDTDGLLKNALGSLWTLPPGEMSRLVFVMTTGSNRVNLATAGTATLSITPRTGTLLGTE